MVKQFLDKKIYKRNIRKPSSFMLPVAAIAILAGLTLLTLDGLLEQAEISSSTANNRTHIEQMPRQLISFY